MRITVDELQEKVIKDVALQAMFKMIKPVVFVGLLREYAGPRCPQAIWKMEDVYLACLLLNGCA